MCVKHGNKISSGHHLRYADHHPDAAADAIEPKLLKDERQTENHKSHIIIHMYESTHNHTHASMAYKM